MSDRPQPGDKVLWIRFSAFGDVLQAIASAQNFKRAYGGAHLTFLSKPEYADILSAHPDVDDVMCWDVSKRPLDFFGAVRRIRAAKFDWLFSMHRSSAAALVALFSGVPRRFGYNRCLQFCYKTTHWEFFDGVKLDVAARDLPSIFTTDENREQARKMLAGLPQKKLFAVIGASKPQKLWPARHWIEFLTPLASEGWGIVLNGHGTAEAAMAREIEDALQNRGVDKKMIANTVGRTPFLLMAAVAAECTAAAGNDTGPLHLASLMEVPTLGFFGVTDAYKAGYRMRSFRELRVTCPNEGCWNYKCPIECLADISPERALPAFRELAGRL